MGVIWRKMVLFCNGFVRMGFLEIVKKGSVWVHMSSVL